MAHDVKFRNDDHAARVIAAATSPSSLADETEADEIAASLRGAIDAAFEQAWAAVHEQSRAEVAATRTAPRRGLGDWTRTQLLAHLETLRRVLGPQLQLAHRHLEAMTDDDLRSLVVDLEEAAAKAARS
jgi:phage protein D